MRISYECLLSEPVMSLTIECDHLKRGWYNEYMKPEFINTNKNENKNIKVNIRASMVRQNASWYEYVLHFDLQFDRKQLDSDREHPRRKDKSNS